MNEYQVVFDYALEGYTAWRFAAYGLIFVVIGFGLWKIPYFNWLFMISSAGARTFGRLCFFFSLFWVTLALPFTYVSHRRVLADYEAGRYQVVEGVVEAYEQPFPAGDGAWRGYKVKDKELWDSNFPVPDPFQPGLSRIVLREGLAVRVTYADSIIFRVEIAQK